MPKTIYLIRHCKATGQEPEASLTEEGQQQAEALAARLAGFPIDRLVSSPFCRACQTALPIARRRHLVVDVDPRLAERALCGPGVPDWRERLAESFVDIDLVLPGGESSREAMRRGTAVVEECLAGDVDTSAIVTHGNLLALILKRFDDRVGFDEWRALSTPDVWRLTATSAGTVVERIFD